MKNNLSLTFHYWSNYPIKSNLISPEQIYSSFYPKIKNFNKKMCKNFIILIFFLKYLTKKLSKINNIDVIRYSFFIKPTKQNIFNYLRAPYKNKTSRNQLYTPRHKFLLKIQIFSKNYYIHNNFKIYNFLLNFLKKNLICFESNIIYLNKLNILYKGLIYNF